MLKKFPTNLWMDCPFPKHHWETTQEYADAYLSEFFRKHCKEFHPTWTEYDIEQEIEKYKLNHK